MDKNWKLIKEFTKEHKGELVLNHFDVVRLEGCKDIPNDDYYYIVRESGFCGKEVLCSAVFNPIPLKGFLPDNIYEHLEEIFTMNTIEGWNQRHKKD